MKNYRVRTSCEVLGVWRDAGTVLPLTDLQAKELAPPFGNVVVPVDIEMEARSDVGLDGTKRRGRRITQ